MPGISRKHDVSRALVKVTLFCLACALGLRADDKTDGIAAFNAGRYSVALRKLQEAGKDGESRTFLALTQAAMGDCQAALPVLTGQQTDPVLERLAGLAAAKCYGSDERAFSVAAQLEQKYPNDADVLYTAAKLHMRAFNDSTFAMFQRTPSSYRVHELSAEIFEVQNRYADAIPEYRKAIALNASAPDLHYRLGRAILLQSHDAEALSAAAKEFEAELRLSPEDGACEFQLGQIAQVQGNASAAQSHFQQALRLSPNFAEALVAIGKIYTSEKSYDKAIAALHRATELQPANEPAHYALLTAYRDAGQMDKAKQEKATLDKLQKPPEGEFSDFLKKLGEKQPEQ